MFGASLKTKHSSCGKVVYLCHAILLCLVPGGHGNANMGALAQRMK